MSDDAVVTEEPGSVEAAEEWVVELVFEMADGTVRRIVLRICDQATAERTAELIERVAALEPRGIARLALRQDPDFDVASISHAIVACGPR